MAFSIDGGLLSSSLAFVTEASTNTLRIPLRLENPYNYSHMPQKRHQCNAETRLDSKNFLTSAEYLLRIQFIITHV